MVEKFQCPGCTCGRNTSSGCFKASEEEGLSCDNHSAGTFRGGVGNINLGLPAGFNRIGPINKHTQQSNILLSLELPQYNMYNIPVWAAEVEGYLIVRRYCPRINQTWVDVIKDKKISSLPEQFHNTVIDITNVEVEW